MNWNVMITVNDCPFKHIDFLDFEWCEILSIENKTECCENNCPLKEKQANQRPEQEEYKENNFCWDIRCCWLKWINTEPATCGNIAGCKGTYKDFMEWLKSHNYKIVKEG